MVDFEVVWSRIKANSGEKFIQIRGKEFTYNVKNDYVVLNSANQNIPQNNFKEALEYVPFKNTVQLQKLRGPSYIFSILMDIRIRGNDW